MAPLPPTPKITEISANGGASYVPFAEGWKSEPCYMAFDGQQTATVIEISVKGNNLTRDYLNTLVLAIPSVEPGPVIDMINEVGDHYVLFINTNVESFVGDPFQIIIDGVTSGEMTVSKPA